VIIPYLTMITNFFLLVIISRHYAVSEVGLFVLYQTLFSLGLSAAFPGRTQTLLRDVSEGHPSSIVNYLSAFLFLLLLGVLLIIPMSLFFKNYLIFYLSFIFGAYHICIRTLLLAQIGPLVSRIYELIISFNLILAVIMATFFEILSLQNIYVFSILTSLIFGNIIFFSRFSLKKNDLNFDFLFSAPGGLTYVTWLSNIASNIERLGMSYISPAALANYHYSIIVPSRCKDLFRAFYLYWYHRSVFEKRAVNVVNILFLFIIFFIGFMTIYFLLRLHGEQLYLLLFKNSEYLNITILGLGFIYYSSNVLLGVFTEYNLYFKSIIQFVNISYINSVLTILLGFPLIYMFSITGLYILLTIKTVVNVLLVIWCFLRSIPE
jgi:hypothetical protein